MALAPRPYRIEEYTRTVCPRCFKERPRASDEPGVWKDGMVVSHGGSLWMRRFCSAHGATESLYEEDESLWRAREGWGTPTLEVTPDRASNFGGSPQAYAEGLPASHGQHTCILLLNLTQRCNYSCPTCYAAAQAPGAPRPDPELPSRQEILHTVRTAIEREGGKLSVLMLSGGEPTIREDLAAIIDDLLLLPITRIMLNTNGRRLARDDRFLEWLAARRERIEVYLQFDGADAQVAQVLRGEDVTAEKQIVLQRLDQAGIWSTLVMTIARGLNEHLVGEVVQLGLGTPRCAGIALQPVFGSGRSAGFDPLSRSTPTGVLKRLGEQTQGVVSADDFIPLPCSHRDCCDITYLLRGQDDRWRSLPRLVGRDELKKWLHVVSNTIAFDAVAEPVRAMVQSGVLARVFSEQMPVRAEALGADLSWMCDCVPGLPELLGGAWKRIRSTGSSPASTWQALRNPQQAVLDSLAERTFRITVKMFMDAHTFHEARLRQCCVHTGTFESDPRRYSFCWRWLFADASDFPEAPAQNFIPLHSVARSGL